jgi:hypothetical protein
MVTTYCTNGAVSNSTGASDGEEVTSADADADYIYESYDIPLDESYDEGPEAASLLSPSRAACVARSRAYDNIPANTVAKWLSPNPIRMTEMRVRLSWAWDGNRVRGLGRFRVEKFHHTSTWWRETADRGAFVYQKSLNPSGVWVKQGAEAWQYYYNYKFNRYLHWHWAIFWVDRLGRCYAEKYSDGELPGYNNSRFEFDVYRAPYEPRST